jgi:hypothetical protein
MPTIPINASRTWKPAQSVVKFLHVTLLGTEGIISCRVRDVRALARRIGFGGADDEMPAIGPVGTLHRCSLAVRPEPKRSDPESADKMSPESKAADTAPDGIVPIDGVMQARVDKLQ